MGERIRHPLEERAKTHFECLKDLLSIRLGYSLEEQENLFTILHLDLERRTVCGAKDLSESDCTKLLEWTSRRGIPFCGDLYKVLLDETVVILEVMEEKGPHLFCALMVFPKSPDVRAAILALEMVELLGSETRKEVPPYECK